jgi:hypothetical protein
MLIGEATRTINDLLLPNTVLIGSVHQHQKNQ